MLQETRAKISNAYSVLRLNALTDGEAAAHADADDGLLLTHCFRLVTVGVNLPRDWPGKPSPK